MLSNSVQMCIDEKSKCVAIAVVKYEVPIFCINMPKSFSRTTVAEAHLTKNFEERTLNVSSH